MSSSFFGLELCLSQRADLINPVVRQVLRSKMPLLPPPGFNVVAHVVETDPVVNLHFLVLTAPDEVAHIRQSLIFAGEMMIDRVFSESPWEMPPLLTVYGKELPARLEVYAKCAITDEDSWFVRQGSSPSEAPLLRSMTSFLRREHFELRSLKSVLPIVILNASPTAPDGCHSTPDDSEENFQAERRAWVRQRVAAMKARGLISHSRLTPDDQDLLHTIEGYVRETARTHQYDSMLVIRKLIKQLGFREIEQDYLTAIALEMRTHNGEPHCP